MASMLLDDLIEGLASAVSEAQNSIERHQVERFKSYFDADRRPEKLDIRVPSLHPNAAVGEEEEYRVPILPLVASSLLKIKEVSIDFNIDLIDMIVSDDEDENPKSSTRNGRRAPGSSAKKSIGVDLSGMAKKSYTAHIVLKLEGRELSEGMARVIERLVTSQGVVRTDDE